MRSDMGAIGWWLL